MRLPGITAENICDFISGGSPLSTFINVILTFTTGLVVAVGIIIIVVGGYIYMTAGGSADRIGLAKKFIMSALLGIVLALAAFLILNTISSQFTSNVIEPTFPSPSP